MRKRARTEGTGNSGRGVVVTVFVLESKLREDNVLESKLRGMVVVPAGVE